MKKVEPNPVALKTLQRVIGMVLGVLFVYAIVSALGGFWPTPWLDELGIRWFGRSSWRLRIVGTFCVFGMMLLGVLLLALMAKTLVKRLR